MNTQSFVERAFEKANIKALSGVSAAMLMGAGVYMCIKGLNSNGAIDIKSTIIQGRIDTGSLGLMVIFLATAIFIVINLNKPFKGEQVKIIMNGNEIEASGLSYRKLKEMVAFFSKEAKSD